jgi:Methyltransferase domain
MAANFFVWTAKKPCRILACHDHCSRSIAGVAHSLWKCLDMHPGQSWTKLRGWLSRSAHGKRSSQLFENGLLFENEQSARSYLETQGVLPLLVSGSEAEIPAVLCDLAFLHRAVYKKQPKVILEFGVGFSTLVMAHALKQRHKPSSAEFSKIYSVDTSEEWIQNLKQKLPDDLTTFVTITQSDVEILEHNGQLCHAYQKLPNVRPDFIYLDGPDPRAVKGNVRGLEFTMNDGRTRPPVSADILFYETTIRRRSIIVVDGRLHNIWFLRNNFKRHWRSSIYRDESISVFELLK